MIDGTIAAQKALSAIVRTGERFGTEHLTRLLTGDATDAIRKFGHERLPTFGVGKEYGDREWRSIFRQLHGAGILALDITGYGTWSVTEAGRRVLKGADKVTLRTDTLKPDPQGEARRRQRRGLGRRRFRRRGAVRSAAPTPVGARQGATRRGLCRVRRQDLDRHGPAQATTAAEMSAVHGVGEPSSGNTVKSSSKRSASTPPPVLELACRIGRCMRHCAIGPIVAPHGALC